MGLESRGVIQGPQGPQGFPSRSFIFSNPFYDFELTIIIFFKPPVFFKEEMNLLSFTPHSWITYRSHLELNINTVHQCRPCSKWRMSTFSRLQTLNVR